MPFEAVKCPQCGANVEVEANTAMFFCTYCGTRLQANRSSLGILSANILSGIKDDTSIVAKRSALQLVNEQLELLEEKRRLEILNFEENFEIQTVPVFQEAWNRTGFFKNPKKSEYYIAGVAAIRDRMLNHLHDLETMIAGLRQRQTSLKEEISYLMMHV